jgi:hypothetical protein
MTWPDGFQPFSGPEFEPIASHESVSTARFSLSL